MAFTETMSFRFLRLYSSTAHIQNDVVRIENKVRHGMWLVERRSPITRLVSTVDARSCVSPVKMDSGRLSWTMFSLVSRSRLSVSVSPEEYRMSGFWGDHFRAHGFLREGEPRILCWITSACTSSPAALAACLCHRRSTTFFLPGRRLHPRSVCRVRHPMHMPNGGCVSLSFPPCRCGDASPCCCGSSEPVYALLYPFRHKGRCVLFSRLRYFNLSR